jgi:Ca2+-binding RTX toxin-like protein
MAYVTEIQSGSAQYTIENSHETFLLKQGSQLNSAGYGIYEAANWHENTIKLNGALHSTQAMTAVYSLGSETHVVVGESGVITGTNGIAGMGKQFNLVNHGEINATEDAIYLSGTRSHFTNTGTIKGGIVLDADQASVLLEKGGDVNGSITVFSDAGEATRFVNDGTTVASTSGWAYYANAGRDTLINRGDMDGSFSFGAGNDVFDNRGGKISSAVDGGAGNDTFIIDGKVDINEYAGQGTDTVKSSVSQSFISSLLSGDALENLVLTGKKAISGTGNDLANAITGNSASNVLSGLGGADVLAGGKGADVFVFKTGGGVDHVKDFGNGADRLDLRGLDAVTDFADLMKHHVKITGDDLTISTGADKLVLRDVEKSDLHGSDFIF